MSETQNNTIEEKPQTKFRDRLFIAIFGKDTERSKRWRLDLYNVLNGTNYTDPNALELNTIENVIYIKMYNDVSFFTTASRNARNATNCACRTLLNLRIKAETLNGRQKW